MDDAAHAKCSPRHPCGASCPYVVHRHLYAPSPAAVESVPLGPFTLTSGPADPSDTSPAEPATVRCPSCGHEFAPVFIFGGRA